MKLLRAALVALLCLWQFGGASAQFNGCPPGICPSGFLGGAGNQFPPAAIAATNPNTYFDFTSNRSYVNGTQGTNATSLLTVTRASVGWASDLSGNWTQFSNNVARQTNQGLLVEESRTNLFLNSQTPATQTITVTNASTYAVSVIGSGSLTLSGALTGTVTQGSPVIGAASTTSLTVTTSGITGTFVNVNVELGNSVTSPIVTAGASATRAADAISVTTPGTFVSAYSFYFRGIPQTPAAYGITQNTISLDDGTATNRFSIRRNTPSGDYNWNMTAGGVSQFSADYILTLWAQNTSAKVATGVTSGTQSAASNGTSGTGQTAATLPTISKVEVGSQLNTAFFNGYVQAIGLWNTVNLSPAQLQGITQ